MLDCVRSDGVDEIRDWIVRPVQHLHNVNKLEEDHQLHCDRRVVLRPHLPHIVVELVGNDPEQLELEHVLHLGSLVVWVCAVPRELVDPFVRFWHISGWTVQHSALKASLNNWLFLDTLLLETSFLTIAIDHQRLVGIDQNGVPHMDACVLGRIKVKLAGAGKAKSGSRSLVHLQILILILILIDID